MDSNINKTTSCNSFRANIWRPHSCTNCYRPKSLHSSSTGDNTAKKSKSLLKKLSTPARSKKELRQVSQSVNSAEVVCISEGEWEDMPQRPHKNGPMVGVVKPYAVVELDEDSNGEVNQCPEKVPKPVKVIEKLMNECQRSMSVTSMDKPSDNGSSNLDITRYKRGKSVEPLETRRTQSISIKRSSSLRQEVPKSSRLLSLLSRRKAASPSAHVKPLESGLQQATKAALPVLPNIAAAVTIQPKVTSPHPVRRNKATVQLYSHTLMSARKHKKEVAVPARPRNLTLSNKPIKKEETCDDIAKKPKNPPPKPPRTLSTFFSSSDEEHLFQQLLERGDASDDTIKNSMNSELVPVETPAKIRPPRRLRQDDYDHVVRFPQGESGSNQLHVVTRLPRGHAGYYAEVTNSGSTNEFNGSIESNYNTLVLSPPTPPPRELHHKPTHPLTHSHSSHPRKAPPIPPTPLSDKEDDYHSLPCTTPTDEESYYSVLCPSPANNGDYDIPYASPSNSQSDDLENHYSIAFESESSLEQKQFQIPSSYKELDTILSNTLTSIVEKEMSQLIFTEPLWEGVAWEEVGVVSETEALYKGYNFSIKAMESLTEVSQIIELSKYLKSHLHLSLIRSVLPPPSTPLTHLTPSPHYLLTDHTGSDSAHFLLSQRHNLTPDAYADLVLHTLTQLFSALAYLHENGVCHRDVGVESLHGRYVGENWLVQLGGLNYALHRPGPVTESTFVYSYSELQWLGGVDSRLPPEVMDTPNDAQTVDYAYTDAFSAGCMIYELCGSLNPFERNPDLIFKQYTDEDLPKLSLDSKLTPYLQKLSKLLLKRDVLKRITSSTALLMCQALKWLPREWMEQLPTEEEVKGQLCLLRGRVMCEAAKKEEKTLSLDATLERVFLSNCDTTQLYSALTIFSMH